MNIDDKPWDARLAYHLVYPLRHTFITPNYLTSLRLLCGVLAFCFLSTGEYLYGNIGAFFFIVSNLLDHADGELARITGKSSMVGHYYDLASDALVNIFLFLGISIGLVQNHFGIHIGILGGIVGILIAAIFYMRNEIEKKIGREKTRQPRKKGVEMEDVLYIMPIVTFLQFDYYFLLLAGIGTPIFCWLVAKDYHSLKKAPI